jgi:beta-galactosidase
MLEILVANMGRVNYGPHLGEGWAGIPKSVTFNGRSLHEWNIYSLPMNSPAGILYWSGQAQTGEPGFYRGTLHLDKLADTFLDTTELGKGFVWVNGHNLGRVWTIGPQRSLYLPAAWLKKGDNEVIVFDETGPERPVLRGRADPVWSKKSD